MLIVKNISVSVEDKKIISDLSLSIDPGTVHVCMGPNGSGKSTLSYALMGHPRYEITQGSIAIDGDDITEVSPDRKAKAGLFLSLQEPYAIPGVIVSTFLRESFRALYPDASLDLYLDRLSEACEALKFDRSFLDRAVHEGFSGGEKKRCEMLQLLILRPKIVILDEIDSGLDVDALRLVGDALLLFKKVSPESSIILITHYQRILQYITPDYVHVMKDGKVVKTGNKKLADEVEKNGYSSFS